MHTAADAFPPMPELPGVQHKYARIDGLRIHYAEAGAGPPLILLHGWPQHWWSWRHLIGPLAQQYRVICPDARGMGWSEGRSGGYTWQRMARDVVELMDELDIPRARIIGHDWGLVTGYRASFNWPERFEHFTALGGIHLWSVAGGPLRLYLAPWHIYAISLLGRTATTRLGVTERCLRAWRYAGRFTPEETDVYMRAMCRPEAVRATIEFDRNVVLHELPHHARHYRLLRQRVPTLHLNGDRDPLTIGVPPSYRDYADDMQLELVPDCGHFIGEERPEWLLDRLMSTRIPQRRTG